MSRLGDPMQRHSLRVVGPLLLGLLALPWLAAPAHAHVKWFNDNYCVSCRPDALDHIVDARWVWLLALFALVSLCAFVIDRLCGDSANGWIDGYAARLGTRPEDILRIGLGVFLVCLWLQPGVLLTPELRTANPAIPWLQLALAATTLSWQTTWIACAGIFALYGLAVAQYGLFHLLDYPIFFGIAGYLAIHSLRPARLLPYAGSVLVGTVAATLLWASLEKWAYWLWTMPVVALHPGISLGFNPKAYIVLAGFVEFFLAYFLLGGRFFGRLAAAALLVIFVVAVVDFGKIDAVGHLMIILALVAIILQGPQPVGDFFTWPRLGLTPGAFVSLAMLIVVLSTYMLGYFGLHHLLYG
jgi:hypothetical protein